MILNEVGGRNYRLEVGGVKIFRLGGIFNGEKFFGVEVRLTFLIVKSRFAFRISRARHKFAAPPGADNHGRSAFIAHFVRVVSQNGFRT